MLPPILLKREFKDWVPNLKEGKMGIEGKMGGGHAQNDNDCDYEIWLLSQLNF